ncbi:phosphotransferase [Candidatus Tremblaya phenacola]|uniref:phosphotransferase n=1 Tax=Candidatus Tremblayella phenacoccinincola TaxID=1010676 RepID=UPI00132F623B|nr:phosphotransferase [Candidatus Tremblaya phenacola]KAH0998349.1 Homoserine kinase [Candidatus Tremblaya phenacola]
MTVFTRVPNAVLTGWSNKYMLGALEKLTETKLGTENSNFFLTTVLRNLIVTIFENVENHELPFYLCFMYFLSVNGVPAPILNSNVEEIPVVQWNGKPVAITLKLIGITQEEPGNPHMLETGRALATLHHISKKHTFFNARAYSISWVKDKISSYACIVPFGKRYVFEYRASMQLFYFLAVGYKRLDDGACHGDLFKDNVTFEQLFHMHSQRLSGCFDFYFSGQEKLLVDVAIALNTWCTCSNGILNVYDTVKLMHSYQVIKPLKLREKKKLLVTLEVMAFRFWLSRVGGFYRKKITDAMNPYDPDCFRFRFRLTARELYLKCYGSVYQDGSS